MNSCFCTPFLIVVFTLLVKNVQLAAILRKNSKEHDENICTTETCEDIASHLNGSVAFSLDPCEDFYTYACGRWKRENPIPEYYSHYGVNLQVEDTVTQSLKELMENVNISHQTSRAFRQAKIYYDTCLNETAINETKSQNALIMFQMFKDYIITAIEASSSSNLNTASLRLTNLFGQLTKIYGSLYFFTWYVAEDSKNSSANILTLDQGSLGLGNGVRQYYLNESFEKQIEAYKTLIGTIVKLFTEDVSHDLNIMCEDIDDIVEFEKILANITVGEEMRHNQTQLYHKWSLMDLEEHFYFMNWTTYFEMIMPKEVWQRFRNEDFKIIVVDVEFFLKLQDLLIKSNQRTVLNYIIWRFLDEWMEYADLRYTDAYQEFLKVYSGSAEESDRDYICISQLTEDMPLAIGALFVKEYFTEDDKLQATVMAKNVTKTFLEMISDSTWMDDETKQRAIYKANLMKYEIGYQNFIMNDTQLDDEHSNLSITEFDTFFEIKRKISVWQSEKNLIQLLKPVDDKDAESPATVNAFYMVSKNSIIFPAAVLQFPFFKADLPMYVNYGFTGATMGHEITHGFDDEGSQYDAHGNLVNWWSEGSLERFKNKTKCVIEQFDNYVLPDSNLHVNGERTISENIADIGGVIAAFKAYKEFLIERNKEENRIRLFERFTNEQMFFISYANFFCENRNRESEVEQVLGDDHSPGMFRVNGPLMSMDDFVKTFNCPVGSAMNPKEQKKCSVW